MIRIFKDKMGRPLTYGQAWKKATVRFENYLLDFELMVLRWVGHIPFHTIRNLVYRSSGIRIGKGSIIHMWANFYQPKKISIGEDSIIGDHALLDGRASLKIGDHVDVASSVMIFNSEHDLDSDEFVARLDEVVIGDYCFVGPRAIILPGVKIGKGAVVAAGAVVTKDVNEFDVVGGVPAVKIGTRVNKILNYRLGRARLFQ